MNLESNITRAILIGIAVIILVITVTISLPQGAQVGGKRPIIFDGKMISALQNISKIVPKNQTIVTPNFTPIIEYFTAHDTITPYSVTSYSSLLSLMNNKNYYYLLVFENQSDVEGLVNVFDKENLPNLSAHFRNITTFTTEFSKLHLYERVT